MRRTEQTSQRALTAMQLTHASSNSPAALCLSACLTVRLPVCLSLCVCSPEAFPSDSGQEWPVAG